MKKVQIITGIVLSTGLIFGAQKAHAADDDQYLTEKGNANVQITSGEDDITPDPVQPFPTTGPILPVKDLGITSATNLYFDAIALSTSTVTRDALYVRYDKDAGTSTPISNIGTPLPDVKTDGTDLVPGFSVTDRRGTGEGWDLQLTLGDFTEQNVAEGKTAKTLRGAKLLYPVVTPLSNFETPVDERPVTLSQEFNAGDTGAKSVMKASAGQGKGMWEARYNSRAIQYAANNVADVSPIQLQVPSDNYAGSYQAVMSWNLVAGPQTTPAG